MLSTPALPGPARPAARTGRNAARCSLLRTATGAVTAFGLLAGIAGSAAALAPAPVLASDASAHAAVAYDSALRGTPVTAALAGPAFSELGLTRVAAKRLDTRPARGSKSTTEPTSPTPLQPVVTEPVTTDPVVTEPVTTDAVVTEPVDSSTTEPGTDTSSTEVVTLTDTATATETLTDLICLPDPTATATSTTGPATTDTPTTVTPVSDTTPTTTPDTTSTTTPEPTATTPDTTATTTPTTTTPTTSEEPPAPEVGAVAAVEPALLPFAATSPWRLGVGQSAQFAEATDPRNVAIANVDASGAAWVNGHEYSHPVAWATDADPLAAMTDSFHQLNGVPKGGTWMERIPASARIAAGTDKHMHVITPDRRYVQEHFKAVRLSETQYTTKRRHEVDLTGSGLGPQNGTRAYGGSALGGLIRAWEVDPAHPSYTGAIQHPLAIALRPDQLYYSGIRLPQDGVGATFNKAGYGLAQGYVWPATEQDSSSPWSYSGAIPMGSYFAIPPEVDIASLGLKTEAARMVARAAQDYGVYVTDRSGSSSFYIEDDGGAATRSFRSALIGSSYTATDVKRIFKALRVVTNNSAATPNGGTLQDARRGVTPPTALK